MKAKKVIWLKKKMYDYAPALLVSGGLILWLSAWYNFNHGLAWMPFVIIQIIVNALCGMMIKKLHQQAYTDMLTGLCSRRCFYKKLLGMITKSPIALVLIDIDNFKSINDIYGHRIGDQVLQETAGILQNNTRRNDIVARWGGEEFAIILPQTEDKEAFKIADRIRKVVEEHNFSCDENTCRLTVSIGIASTKGGASIDVERLFKIADKALYKAKEKKNYVAVAEG